MSKKIYIAGPYTAKTEDEKQENIARARDAAAELFRRGWVPFCPHSMTADFDVLYPDIPYKTYIVTDLIWLHCCDAIVMLPGSEQSIGAMNEYREAESLGLMFYGSLGEVPDLTQEDIR